MLPLKHYMLSLLKKTKHYIGKDIFIENIPNKYIYIPQNYQAVLVISADFELAWGPRYSKRNHDSLRFAIELARRERKNIPVILDLCELYNIPITWATVGHLFLRDCQRINGVVHPEIPSVKPYKGVFWDFTGQDWFEHDPCTNLESDPEWYGADLIEMILNSRIKHEIGNHSFSHIDCRDEICSPDLLKAELIISKRFAEQFGVQLKSFVHPGHTIGNLNVLVEEGFTNFRTDYRNLLGYPKKHKNGLWEFEQTMEIAYFNFWSLEFQVKRYVRIIQKALKTNTVCVFWFHPSLKTIAVENIFPALFQFINDHRDKLWVTTHSEYVNFLNQRNNGNE